ncbi:UDP-glucuronic acid decarboxylase family protein [Frigidibacter sp. SD6-1]|uniref:UDP-glucuronic acid decarboxylase family protein n=1 Tax=Frigidibacter sp. SD6-1 TaxID=3032581 RepID=UPI0024DF8FCD|nr:UDP-glucuronic acid decarboxylase family protein [Frigidibacter sp. SD6-1]
MPDDFLNLGAGSPFGLFGRGRPAHKTVLVAGGAGFVGSHLIDRLLANGHRVICLDNLSTGRLANIAAHAANERFTLIRQDVCDPIQIAGAVDEIFNLACPASPPKYQKDPVHTFRTSVIGAMNLLELARAKGARIFQASTSEVYGDPEVSLQSENYRGNVNTFGPRACYDEGKRAAETLFHDYHHQHGVEIRIARIFNTYGPRMCPDDGRVVSNFVVQALSGRDMTIHGDGSQTRSFCYVDDLVEGILRLMASAVSEPVNLGNPGEFTMAELAAIVREKTGTTARLVHRPLPTDDPRQRRPDISRARKALGWAPLVALSEGLDRTIAHFAAELGRPLPSRTEKVA